MKVDASACPIAGEAAILRMWERTRKWWRHRPQRKLRLCETLALGERRSIAIVEFEHVRYLLGCTSSAITLLSRLPRDGPESESACDR